MGGAWFTDEGTLCGYAFCGFVTLFELAWAGIPGAAGAAVFDLAISARAFSMAEVSGAGAGAAAFPGCSFNDIKSRGGVPSGVVECIATERTVYQRSLYADFHAYMLVKGHLNAGEPYRSEMERLISL